MLHTAAHGFRLKQLGGIKNGIEPRGIEEGLLHVAHDFSVGRGIPLMFFHHIGKDIPFLRAGKCLHRLQGRKGLETKLGKVAEKELPVLRKGLSPVPYIPIMHISPVFIVGCIKASS